MNIEDTTLLNDIESVRNAARDILGEDFLVSRDGQVPVSGSSQLVTYACNSFFGSQAGCAAVDIGTHAIGHEGLDGVISSLGGGIGQAESELGLGHDEIFDIDYNDTYDKFDNHSLILM